MILDVLLGTAEQSAPAEEALRRATREGQLIVCESVVAEISPELDDVPGFLAGWKVLFIPGTLESAALAGRMYSTYLRRTGNSGRVVPDFLIGAHALKLANRLVTRDRGFYRDYFRGLKIIEP